MGKICCLRQRICVTNKDHCVRRLEDAISNVGYPLVRGDPVRRASFSKFLFFVVRLLFQHHLDLRHTCMRVSVLVRRMRK